MDYITNKMVFDTIIEELKAADQWPQEIIDYALASGDNVELRSAEIHPFFKLDFGGSEGIYLDIYVDGEELKYASTGEEQVYLGCVKALEESEDAFRRFAVLGADFQLKLNAYIYKHHDELNRKGYSVKFYSRKDSYKIFQTIAPYCEEEHLYDTFLAVRYNLENFILIDYSDTEEAWNFTVYARNFNEIDGGMIGTADDNIITALKEILKMFFSEPTEQIDIVDYDILSEIVDAELVYSSVCPNVQTLEKAEAIKNSSAAAYEIINNDTKKVVKGNYRIL